MPTADPRHRTGPQVIPRPPVHRPGGPRPGPTCARPTGRRCPLAAVVGAVAGAWTGRATPPATAAEVSEFSRTFADAFPDANPAAVLVALFEEAGEARVLLTVRSAAPAVPPGRGGLPRGQLDPGEGDRRRRPPRGVRGGRPRPGRRSTVVGHLTAMPTVVVEHPDDRRWWPSSTAVRPTLAGARRGGPGLRRGPGRPAGRRGLRRGVLGGRPAGRAPTGWPAASSPCGSSRWPARRSGGRPPGCSPSCCAWSSGVPTPAAGPIGPEPGARPRVAGPGYGPGAQAVSWGMVGRRSVGAAAVLEVRRTAPGSGGQLSG